PGEIFLTMSKQGSTISGLMDSFATAVSLALQHGVSLEVLCTKFTHVRFEPSGWTGNPKIGFAKSIVDYIFRWLELKFLTGEQGELFVPALVAVHSSAVPSDKDAVGALGELVQLGDAPACNICGSLMVRSGTCYRCMICGSVRGGSQARIMLADDGKKYVVKFQGNPQCTRVLANDYLACRLARMIGLSVPEPAIILVDEKTILEQQITFTLAGRAVAARPGLQFGSALVTAEVLDWLPGTMLGRVRNLREFAGVLAFDKWTGNADGRQVVFHKKMRERKYTASFIDFGYCFSAGEWSFPDAPLRGVYGLNDVYQRIESWHDFAPWLSRIERFPARQLQGIADEIPCEWYGERAELQRLLNRLLERRSIVRQLIEDFRTSSRNPFPNWIMERSTAFATEARGEPLAV
ncbi:MAG TPA: HipA family kinase, partial [Terriglobales bacterium]|nr:HipA family kinase [Terriglobales bacterium]